MIDGDIESGSVMAGQSVGLVTREQTTGEIFEELVSQAVAVLRKRGERGIGSTQLFLEDLSDERHGHG